MLPLEFSNPRGSGAPLKRGLCSHNTALERGTLGHHLEPLWNASSRRPRIIARATVNRFVVGPTRSWLRTKAEGLSDWVRPPVFHCNPIEQFPVMLGIRADRGGLLVGTRASSIGNKRWQRVPRPSFWRFSSSVRFQVISSILGMFREQSF